jgi:hypothetical protein
MTGTQRNHVAPLAYLVFRRSNETVGRAPVNLTSGVDAPPTA